MQPIAAAPALVTPPPARASTAIVLGLLLLSLIGLTSGRCLIEPDGAGVAVRGNRLHSGEHVGLLMRGGARGTVEENEVFGNACPNVEVRGGAEPLVAHVELVHGPLVEPVAVVRHHQQVVAAVARR